MLKHMYNSDKLSQTQASTRHRHFREEGESVEDDERPEYLQAFRATENNEKVSAAGRRFQSADEIKRASQAELQDIAKNGPQKCFDDLYKRWQKCVVAQGSYVKESTLQGIPAHVDIEDNECADVLAKEPHDLDHFYTATSEDTRAVTKRKTSNKCFIKPTIPELNCPRNLSPTVARHRTEISENKSDGGELSCSNLDYEEDIRLSESDCEESDESADITNNIPVNPDIHTCHRKSAYMRLSLISMQRLLIK
ncbi:hypothetical protein TNCV_2572201 [Trichonephila clavipes]|nr:hypothetical protein TNCV_2572201 [Trichonephila clavipes]